MADAVVSNGANTNGGEAAVVKDAANDQGFNFVNFAVLKSPLIAFYFASFTIR